MPAIIPPTLTQAGTRTQGRDRGRRLLAASSFRPGELIATFDDPLVAIPDSAHLGTTTCSYCLSRPGGGAGEGEAQEPAQKRVVVRACTACRTAAYCSTRCQRADWNRAHKRGECGAFQRARARAASGPGASSGGGASLLPTPVRALIRLLVLLPAATGAAENDESVAVAVQGLESHAAEIRGREGRSGAGTPYRDLELQARAALHYLGREPGVDEVQGAIDLLCKVSEWTALLGACGGGGAARANCDGHTAASCPVEIGAMC